ncbi:hypothetical protein HanRHA438_Chr14g0640521 [Helianthus annuus]|nr:hypothetical protein HanRHA438_Chr14g0640521 [Helianthus annuus]
MALGQNTFSEMSQVSLSQPANTLFHQMKKGGLTSCSSAILRSCNACFLLSKLA